MKSEIIDDLIKLFQEHGFYCDNVVASAWTGYMLAFWKYYKTEK